MGHKGKTFYFYLREQCRVQYNNDLSIYITMKTLYKLRTRNDFMYRICYNNNNDYIILYYYTLYRYTTCTVYYINNKRVTYHMFFCIRYRRHLQQSYSDFIMSIFYFYFSYS